MKTFIYIKTNFEAYHRWPSAPDEVAFLRNTHRHIFYVSIDFRVNHDDRELEFFILKKELDAFLSVNYKGKVFSESCEMIAKSIGKYLKELKNLPIVKVEVNEDNQNGSYVEF